MKKLIKSLTLIGVAALSLMVSPTLQAQTSSDFNTQSSTNGWKFWLPDQFDSTGAPDYIIGSLSPTIIVVTNNISAGNKALFMHTGTTNVSYATLGQWGNLPRTGCFYTNSATLLTNFTMTGEFFHWTNGQSQMIGLAGRVALPVPAVAVPGVPTSDYTFSPRSIFLAYHNQNSSKAFHSGNGGTDRLRIMMVMPDSPGALPESISDCTFEGPTETAIAGRSLSPNSTNGHYRLIFTANGLDLTGQIVDLSTGLPMMMGSPESSNIPTNILRTLARYINENQGHYTNVYWLTNNGAIYTNGVLQAGTNTGLGGSYGFLSTGGDSATLPTLLPNNQWDPTQGQPLDPKVDNFAIVKGVVKLYSAATVNGTYTEDTTAGIEVSPKRITVPTNGSERFYRIYWLDCDHTPTITGVTLGSPVSVAVSNGSPYPATTTTVVQTVVLTYN